jgi:hypothetical protein
MKVSVRCFGLPKAGNTDDEYEDAFWPLSSVQDAAETFRVAVADGASTTAFSGLWARLLVEAFGKGELTGPDLEPGLPSLRRAWLAAVTSKPLPWHGEAKVRRGAYSTLLGLSLKAQDATGAGRWASVATGDSCLVHMAKDSVRCLFPLDCSEAFQADPHLVGSRSDAEPLGPETVRLTEGSWEPADLFYLMTDALACWFIREKENGRRPWSDFELLCNAGDRASFAELVTALRDNKALRNDDVTLLRVLVSA